MPKDPTPEQWAATVLQKLGIHQTPGAMQAMVGWARAEGGHWNNDARYNPLNTTQPMAGAGNTGSQGNIKVYKSWQQGVDATVKTLENGRYGVILNALKSGNANRVGQAIGQTPWGTGGGLVQRTIASTAPISDAQPLPLGKVKASAVKASAAEPDQAPYAAPVAPSVDNSGLRRAAALSYLQQGGVQNSAATLGLAAQAQSFQDTPAVYAAPPAASAAPLKVKAPAATAAPGTHLSGSKVLELIYNDGGQGFGIKNGQTVAGSQVYSGVWAGHANHVHVAAGPKTVIALGKYAQKLGLSVGENPNFGGEDPSKHVAGSYHNKAEAIDVSAPLTPAGKALMKKYAKAVAQYNRTKSLPK